MKNYIRLAAILLILGTTVLPARSLDFSSAYAVEPRYSVIGASTIYVDASNVSGIEDGTQAHPYNRIQEGLGVALSGDTVRVAAGTYFENITLKDGVMLMGAGAKVTHIDGGGAGSVVTANNLGTGAVLDGFTLTNGSGTWEGSYTYDGGLYVLNSTLVLKNCIVTGNWSSDGPGGIQGRDSTVEIRNCTFSDNSGWWGAAISLLKSEAEIAGSIIDESSSGYGGAVYISDSSQVMMENNLIMHTVSSVPAIGIGASSTVTITNNTIVDNFGNGIATNIYPVGFETGSATIQNNILWGNNDDLVNLSPTYSDIEDGDPGEGNISTYPMFINPTQKDYRLRPESLCIDKGINDGAPKVDMEGDPRPIDGDGDGMDVVDMGADEFNPATYHPMTYVFLPLLTRNVCSGALFFDDFSDPGSGWPVVLDNPALRLEYLYGEYRMLRNRTDGYLVATPGMAASDYSLSVVARDWNGLFGSYGLAFGMSEDLSQFYTFEVYSDGWYGLYRHSSGDWTVLAENMSWAVNPGASSNQLKVERNGALINGYVNGQLVTSVSDGSFTGSRYVGLILSTYDQVGLDARFDNFAVYSPGCSPGNAGLGQVSATSELDVEQPAWASHWASRENGKGR
jgi:hypothetical protein